MDQTLLAALFANHSYEEFRALIRENSVIYRRNRDAMIEAARKHLPADIRYNTPAAGMFLWFEMPGGFDADRMVETDGMALGVLLIPGSSFSIAGGLKNYMRASFSMITREQVEEGMLRFAVMIERGENPDRSPLKASYYFGLIRLMRTYCLAPTSHLYKPC